MPTTPVAMVNNAVLSTSVVDYYTSPVDSSTTITSFSLQNNGWDDATVTVYFLMTGASYTDYDPVATIKVSKESDVIPVPGLVAQILSPGMRLSMSSTLDNSVVPTVSGRREVV